MNDLTYNYILFAFYYSDTYRQIKLKYSIDILFQLILLIFRCENASIKILKFNYFIINYLKKLNYFHFMFTPYIRLYYQSTQQFQDLHSLLIYNLQQIQFANSSCLNLVDDWIYSVGKRVEYSGRHANDSICLKAVVCRNKLSSGELLVESAICGS